MQSLRFDDYDDVVNEEEDPFATKVMTFEVNKYFFLIMRKNFTLYPGETSTSSPPQINVMTSRENDNND